MPCGGRFGQRSVKRDIHAFLLFLQTIALAGVLAGCSHGNLSVSDTPYQSYPQGTAKNVAVFMDGTANDFESETNVAALYHLARLNNDPYMALKYIEGVGTNGKVLGFAFGTGIGKDVKDAYLFLATHYQNGDDLSLFGFSRGAYAARILSGMIYVAGIPDLRLLSEKDQTAVVEALYDAYTGRLLKKSSGKGGATRISWDPSRRQEFIQSVYLRWERKLGVPIRNQDAVTIRFMGLWDTVEALAIPDYEQNTGPIESNYLDQICNIDKVYHALSLDDNRARIFTPIRMTYDTINTPCPEKSIDNTVEEVWFSGAHADVGGGYAKQRGLSGLSLQWMLEADELPKIFPALNNEVRANPYDVIHDAERGYFIYPWAFGRIDRRPLCYAKESAYNGQRIKLHRSVIDRFSEINGVVAVTRANSRRHDPDTNWIDDRLLKAKWFGECFEKTASGYRLLDSCQKLDVVD